jgi:ribonuclease HII
MTAPRTTRRASAAAASAKSAAEKAGTEASTRTSTRAGKSPAGNTAKPAQSALDFDSPLDIVCGVDEAGRGPLAGPVLAAAVILDPKRRIRGLDDSKVLNAKTREALYKKIVERSIAYCVASASVEEIDTLNILHATMLAMKRAVEGLAVMPTLAKIDGNRCPVLSVRSVAIIGGDALVPAISAASILAKVTRDRMLAELHERFPVYGFDSHVGYSTPQHLAALIEHGPCVHHRRSFAPVREAYERLGVRVTLPRGVAVVAPATLEEAFDVVDMEAAEVASQASANVDGRADKRLEQGVAEPAAAADGTDRSVECGP